MGSSYKDFEDALNGGPKGPANRAATQAGVNRTARSDFVAEYNRRRMTPPSRMLTALGPLEAHEFRPHCLLFTREGCDGVHPGGMSFRGARSTMPHVASTRLFYALNGLTAEDQWRFAGIAADPGGSAAQQQLSQPVCSVRLSGLCTIPNYTRTRFLAGDYLYATMPQQRILEDGSVGCNAKDAGQHPQTMVPIYRAGSTKVLASLMGAAEDLALHAVARFVTDPAQRERVFQGLTLNQEALQEVEDQAAAVLATVKDGLSAIQADHFAGTGHALDRYAHLVAAQFGAANDGWMIEGLGEMRYGRQRDILDAVYANFAAAGVLQDYGGVGLPQGVPARPYVRAAQGAAQLYAAQLGENAQRVQRRMDMEDLEEEDMDPKGMLGQRVALECHTQLNSEFRDRYIGRVVDEVDETKTSVDVELRKT